MMKCLTVILGMLLVTGCGVKGKPMPPLEPVELGRGTPTYKRTAEQAKPATIPDAKTKSTTLPTSSPAPDRRGP